MAIIVPAILETTQDAFLRKLALLSKIQGAERMQIDFADGKFVSNTTVNIVDINPLNPAFSWEAHLLVNGPNDFLDYQIAGFSIIVIHYEAFDSGQEVKTALQSIKELSLKAGLAINPSSSVSVLKDFVELVDQFVVMGVVPGFQGQPFMEGTFQRLAELRRLAPHAIIEVDGGVKLTNAKALAHAGADLLIAGSSLMQTENTQANFDLLSKEAII